MNGNPSRGNSRNDLIFLFALGLLLFLFYPDLFLAKSASLKGDHIEQHYPWAYLLAQSLKHFQIPWWTDLIHCGFPIVAEGQIGAFYPPNLVLYLILPIQWAYSYINVVHFFISGCGTYWYARFMKLGPLAALVSSSIFLFGSAFGGAYYNITSLKTIAWFPFFLLFFERFFAFGKLRDLFFLAVAVAFSLLAGYLQVGIFCLLIFMIYALFRMLTAKDKPSDGFAFVLKRSLLLLLALGFGTLLAFPQLFLTFELALMSNRLNLTEDYAYVGSMSPLAIFSLLLIEAQGLFRGNSLYSGVMSVFFVGLALFSKEARRTDFVRAWCFMGLISLFLALGRWSPLYIALVKVTQFYAFRTPSKFLVFICFALAMLAGAGVDFICRSIGSKVRRRPYSRAAYFYVGCFFSAVMTHAAAYLFFTRGRAMALEMGKWFVARFIYGKAGHPHSLEVYHEKLLAGLDTTVDILSMSNFWNLWNYGLLGVSLILIFFVWRLKSIGRLWLFSALVFLAADLYAFTWRDIRRDFDSYEAINKPPSVISYLHEERGNGRLGRIYGFRNADEHLPAVPSANMLYHISTIGAYSPLILKRYHETIGHFGNVNDSNYAFNPTPEFVIERLPLLDFLGVSHILSTKALSHRQLKTIFTPEDPGVGCFLYANEGRYGKAHFITKYQAVPTWEELKDQFLEKGFDPREVVLLEESEFQKISDGSRFPRDRGSSGGKAKIEVIQQLPIHEEYQLENDRPGFFVVAHLHYPGWKATLDGHPLPLVKAYGLFQAMWIQAPGRHRVVLEYSPFIR